MRLDRDEQQTLQTIVDASMGFGRRRVRRGSAAWILLRLAQDLLIAKLGVKLTSWSSEDVRNGGVRL